MYKYTRIGTNIPSINYIIFWTDRIIIYECIAEQIYLYCIKIKNKIVMAILLRYFIT